MIFKYNIFLISINTCLFVRRVSRWKYFYNLNPIENYNWIIAEGVRTKTVRCNWNFNSL